MLHIQLVGLALLSYNFFSPNFVVCLFIYMVVICIYSTLVFLFFIRYYFFVFF